MSIPQCVQCHCEERNNMGITWQSYRSLRGMERSEMTWQSQYKLLVIARNGTKWNDVAISKHTSQYFQLYCHCERTLLFDMSLAWQSQTEYHHTFSFTVIARRR
jgi:hypothetical protein